MSLIETFSHKVGKTIPRVLYVILCAGELHRNRRITDSGCVITYTMGSERVGSPPIVQERIYIFGIFVFCSCNEEGKFTRTAHLTGQLEKSGEQDHIVRGLSAKLAGWRLDRPWQRFGEFMIFITFSYHNEQILDQSTLD